MIVGLQTWIATHFTSFTSSFSEDLKCAQQSDNFSCSIIAVNTIKHNVFGDALWCSRNGNDHHVEEFLAIMEYYAINALVSHVSCITSPRFADPDRHYSYTQGQCVASDVELTHLEGIIKLPNLLSPISSKSDSSPICGSKRHGQWEGPEGHSEPTSTSVNKTPLRVPPPKRHKSEEDDSQAIIGWSIMSKKRLNEMVREGTFK